MSRRELTTEWLTGLCLVGCVVALFFITALLSA